MEDRLSESVSQRNVYETGSQAYLRAPSRTWSCLSWFPRVDLEAILASEDPGKEVRDLPAQVLYFAMVDRGREDCLEILPLLSQEQFTRICDYDVWEGDRLAPKRLLSWLSLCQEVSAACMIQRFSALDEEYQLACLGPYLSVFTEEDYEHMSGEQQDQLQRFPGNAAYFSVKTDDPALHKGICELIEAAMAEDMSYAMALVSHAGYAVPNEHEHLLSQFRRARLEEDGFVSYEESQDYFRALSSRAAVLSEPSDFADGGGYGPDIPRALKEYDAGLQGSFLERTLAASSEILEGGELGRIRAGLLCLANALCAATKTRPGDPAGLRDTFAHAQGLISLSLDMQSGGDIYKAVALVRHSHPKKLFRVGLGYVYDLRLRVVGALEKSGLKDADQLRKACHMIKPGVALSFLDGLSESFLDLEQLEVIKGLFNRFPLFPVDYISYRDEGVRRLSFAPLGGRGDLRTLIRYLESVFSQIVLARSGRDDCLWGRQQRSFFPDTVLARGLVRGMLGMRFHIGSLLPEELARFASATDEQLHAGCGTFLVAAKMLLGKQRSLLTLAAGAGADSLDGWLSDSAFSDKGLQAVEDLAHRLINSRQKPGSLLSSLAGQGEASAAVVKEAPSCEDASVSSIED